MSRDFLLLWDVLRVHTVNGRAVADDKVIGVKTRKAEGLDLLDYSGMARSVPSGVDRHFEQGRWSLSLVRIWDTLCLVQDAYWVVAVEALFVWMVMVDVECQTTRVP